MKLAEWPTFMAFGVLDSRRHRNTKKTNVYDISVLHCASQFGLLKNVMSDNLPLLKHENCVCAYRPQVMKLPLLASLLQPSSCEFYNTFFNTYYCIRIPMVPLILNLYLKKLGHNGVTTHNTEEQ